MTSIYNDLLKQRTYISYKLINKMCSQNKINIIFFTDVSSQTLFLYKT